jgi:hypothetical protein
VGDSEAENDEKMRVWEPDTERMESIADRISALLCLTSKDRRLVAARRQGGIFLMSVFACLTPFGAGAPEVCTLHNLSDSEVRPRTAHRATDK